MHSNDVITSERITTAKLHLNQQEKLPGLRKSTFVMRLTLVTAQEHGSEQKHNITAAAAAAVVVTTTTTTTATAMTATAVIEQWQ